MQFSTILFIIFAAGAMACGDYGAQCNSPGATDCACNSGHVVACQAADGSGYVWRDQGNCPENPGGLQCVDGHCTVTKLRFMA